MEQSTLLEFRRRAAHTSLQLTHEQVGEIHLAFGSEGNRSLPRRPGHVQLSRHGTVDRHLERRSCVRYLQAVPLPGRLEDRVCPLLVFLVPLAWSLSTNDRLAAAFNRAVRPNRDPDMALAAVGHQKRTWLARFRREAEIDDEFRAAILLLRAQGV